MDKLGEITIDNSFNVVVSCQVDQQLLAKNFTNIIAALKELQESQLKNDAQIKDLISLKQKVDSLSNKVDKLEKDNISLIKDISSLNNRNSDQTSISSPPSDNTNNVTNLQALTKRLQKNQANIIDNIKDINLINKEVSEAKKDIADLKGRIAIPNNGEGQKGERLGFNIQDVSRNMSKQLHQNSERMKDLQVRLIGAEEHISKLDKQLKDLLERKDKDNGGDKNSNISDLGKNKDLQDLKRDLKQKLEVINKKLNNLQSQTDHHDQEIAYLKDILGNNEQIGEGIQAEITEDKDGKQKSQSWKNDLMDLKKRIEQVSHQEKKDVKNLQDEIANLKLQLKELKKQKIQSKTSIEDENQKKGLSHRKSTIQKNDLTDKVNDLILRVNYLQKLLAGSRNNIGGDQKNPQKLPNITRPKRRDPNLTVYPDKEKSGISRKELAQLKAELQAWVKSLLDQGHEKESLQDLYLRIQQLRHNIDKKADAQGTKKGFAFLENKITQLYLFLTQPETEDAMIVRKGFNCLSCSKRVQKLRGKLGPRLNWNNMTTTNYSPPRVGYSKPMGETSLQKEDDLI